MVRNLLAAVVVLALGVAAIIRQDPQDTSTPNAFDGYSDSSSGGYSQPNVFGGSTFYLR
jgi:hypothetical protein